MSSKPHKGPPPKAAALPLPVADPPAGSPATCQDCRWWFDTGAGRTGQCRRHPPTNVVSAGTTVDFYRYLDYGVTRAATPGCGDGEPRR